MHRTDSEFTDTVGAGTAVYTYHELETGRWYTVVVATLTSGGSAGTDRVSCAAGQL